MITKFITLALAITATCSSIQAGEQLTSPDQNIVVKTTNQDGEISYSVNFKGDVIHVTIAPGGGHNAWIRPVK